MIAEAPFSTTLLSGFDDQAVWHELQPMSPTNTVFQTWHWQKAWWDVFGRGELLLIMVKRDGRPVALAPLFAEGGMVFFVGSGGSDYLDFLGNTSDSAVLDLILETAREMCPGFVGFRFYLVPDDSPTGSRLQAAAERLGLEYFDEGDMVAPALMLDQPAGAGLAAANKTRLVRYERYLKTEGNLRITHLTQGNAILPHLDEFFAQHIARWESTDYPSLFRDPAQTKFYRLLCSANENTSWLRFTRLDLDDRPIAFHFGFCCERSYLCYKPTFAVEMEKRSPGQVLLRQLILAAANEGAHTFDFGLGDEAYKRRFANRFQRVRTWGLYPFREKAP